MQTAHLRFQLRNKKFYNCNVSSSLFFYFFVMQVNVSQKVDTSQNVDKSQNVDTLQKNYTS